MSGRKKTPNSPGPALTKEELAFLDYLIADVEASGEPLSPAFITSIIRVVVRAIAKQAVRQVVMTAVETALEEGGRRRRLKMSDDELKRAALEQLNSPGIPLDELIRLRNSIADE